MKQIIDIGDSVICDSCNDDYTNSTECGGILLGSWAYCPKCTAKLTSSEREQAELCCPAWMPFKDWVLQLRGGNNTIQVLTGDDFDSWMNKKKKS